MPGFLTDGLEICSRTDEKEVTLFGRSPVLRESGISLPLKSSEEVSDSEGDKDHSLPEPPASPWSSC